LGSADGLGTRPKLVRYVPRCLIIRKVSRLSVSLERLERSIIAYH
jgi:hypothetical protein